MESNQIDKPLCNCGVVGIYNHPQAAFMTYFALHALQHRGQESAGIAAARDSASRPGKRKFAVHKAHGLVLDIFSDEKILTQELHGDAAIGHNRYSTTGSNVKRANIQPFYVSNPVFGNLALSHNGNLTNTLTLRRELSNEGALFQTSTDSEIILHLVARSREQTMIGRIRESLRRVRGAYSLTILTDDMLIAARDPHGFRPLCIGKLGDSFVVVSETCALDIISAQYVRDVHPNEIVVIDRETVATGEIKSYWIDDVAPQPAYCIFEYVYFSRPDSMIFGHSVDKVRRKLGKRLAEESGMDATEPGGKVVVINVPDSSNTATLGYQRMNQALRDVDTRYEIGLIRSHYVGRTFIAPGQSNREFKVKTKFNVVRGVLEGQQVVVVDDSIVRGTTSKALVNLIREAKPREVHLRITSPPITHPCKYGMDFPSSEELIANQYNLDVEQIRAALGVDTLHYLSVEGLLNGVPHENGEGYCTACFTGNYPVEIDSMANKLALEEMG
jgi:amidophosphoribosyltransferase